MSSHAQRRDNSSSSSKSSGSLSLAKRWRRRPRHPRRGPDIAWRRSPRWRPSAAGRGASRLSQPSSRPGFWHSSTYPSTTEIPPGTATGRPPHEGVRLAHGHVPPPADRFIVGASEAPDVDTAGGGDPERLVLPPRRRDDARVPGPHRELPHARVLGGGVGHRLLPPPATVRRQDGRAESPGGLGHDP